ncbi:MAG: type II toxin-antitoxin system PemK/MazF family toxin [Terracidiphilus sp.]
MTEPERAYPLRGEIWWAHFSFDPPDKNRPAIIVSPNGRNSHPRALTVLAAPLSTSIHKPGPSHMFLRAGETGLREDSVARAENIGTIARDQLKGPVAGQRPLTNTQICRLAGLVKLAMGCVE